MNTQVNYQKELNEQNVPEESQEQDAPKVQDDASCKCGGKNGGMTVKRKLSVVLLVAAVLCFIGAGSMILGGLSDDRSLEKGLASMRPAQELQESEAVSVPEVSLTTTPVQEPKPSESLPPEPTPSPSPSPEPPPTTKPLAENPYQKSFQANSDMVAWLQIPGTVIDYPVMWTPGDENYYLYRDFEGRDNKNGSLLLDTDSALEPLTTNLIIHGHNMRSGAMFGNLTDYESEDYFKGHRYMSLYTKDCERRYEVVAVFRSQVYKKTDEVFKFYKFFQADSKEEFEDFYNNIKELSLYDTGVTAAFGDHFLTLSTCVYHVEQGRFVVVAKEIEQGECYLPIQEQVKTATE